MLSLQDDHSQIIIYPGPTRGRLSPAEICVDGRYTAGTYTVQYCMYEPSQLDFYHPALPFWYYIRYIELYTWLYWVVHCSVCTVPTACLNLCFLACYFILNHMNLDLIELWTPIYEFLSILITHKYWRHIFNKIQTDSEKCFILRKSPCSGEIHDVILIIVRSVWVNVFIFTAKSPDSVNDAYYLCIVFVVLTHKKWDMDIILPYHDQKTDLYM